MIDFATSQKIVDDISCTPTIIIVPLVQSMGYVLAEDIIALEDSPSSPTAAMDGYALRHEDIALGNLEIMGINPAGHDTQMVLESKKCIKTFTGSLMPQGADTLMPIENVEVQNNHIIIHSAVPKGFSVRDIGENYAKNELLIPKGVKIDFAQIGVMASLNIAQVSVYAKPKVAILATGSELLDLGQMQTLPSQIRSSNHITIEAIAQKYGATTINHGCIKDDKTIITHALQKALKSSDIVVTSGGVSVGDFDFVKDVIKEIGFEVLFQGVAIKPGQHIMLAQKESQFILGLPGFAYSATVTALLYLVPLIAKLNHTKNALKHIKATLREPFIKKTNKTEFVACNYRVEEGQYYVNFHDKKIGSSAIITNLLGDTALMVAPLDVTGLTRGDEVLLLLWD